MTRRLLPILLLFIATFLQAQDPFEKVFVTPNISIGYTIGAVFNIGVELDVTTSITTKSDVLKRGGLSVGHYWVMGTELKPHRMTSLNAMFENEFMDIKTGYAIMQYKWGYSNVNRFGVPAYAFDISFSNRERNIPWVGVKTLLFQQREWVWFTHPYASFYAKQKFPIVE